MTLADRTVPADNKEARKGDQIIQAALRVFAEHGLHGTPVPPIAAEAGVGVGTLYRYFDSKETLVNAVFKSAKSKLKDYLQEDHFEDDPRQVFHRFWNNLVRFTTDHPEEFYFLELQDHTPYLNAESRKLEWEVLSPISQFCIDGTRRGLFKTLPSDTMMAMIWGAFVGLMKASKLGYARTNRDILQQAEELCWQMLLK